MKVQCQCGAKYAIDVTRDMATNPVRFVCPACNLDLSGPINELVRQELGVVAEAPAPSPAPAAAPTRVGPARLSLSRTVAPATHGAPVETRPDPGATSAEAGQPCPKHPGEVAMANCYLCRKPICPSCMKLFGYFCSPGCRGKAEASGIHVPVFAGQNSVVEERRWRRIWRLSAMGAVAAVAFVCLWIWWAWFATVPHAIFSVRFPDMSYAGNSRIVGKNQLVFIHGGLLARYPLGGKTAVWTNEIISRAQVEAEADRRMKGYQAMVNAAISRGADERPHVPALEDLRKEAQEEFETSLHLFVQEQNIWIARDGKLTQYDWDTGKSSREIAVPSNDGEAAVSGDELQFIDENAFGQQVVTHVNLTSGEARTEALGEPRPSAVLAGTKPVTRNSADGKTAAAAGLPTRAGVNPDQPMDPAQVAQDAQSLPYAAKIALPATLSNTRHQNDILNEMNADDAQNAPVNANRVRVTSGISGQRDFVNGPGGSVEWSAKVLEQLGRSRQVMKPRTGQSALANNPSVTNTAAIANEILNDMQRDRGGDAVTDDVSRYAVTVHRADAKDVPDWSGEVVGPPSVLLQKTVTIVAGGAMFIVLDKSNQKLWQASLTQKLGRNSGLDENDPAQTSVGLGPCVEHDHTLYVYDAATVTAFDLATGNVRWRVPTIGTVGLFFDDQGALYVNSTTADLDTLRFERQIDIQKKIVASVLRVDCETGKVFWTVQPGGFVSHVEGKFVICFASHQAPDLDPDALTTLPGMLDSAMDIRRLDIKTGRQLWDYPEKRAPVSVRFHGNFIELVFRKEVEILKFLSF